MLLKHEDINSFNTRSSEEAELITSANIVKHNTPSTSPSECNYITYDVTDIQQLVRNTSEGTFDVLYTELTVELYTESEESLISYLAGWLIRKCMICRSCRESLVKPVSEHSYCSRSVDLFTDKKRYRTSGQLGLIEPCDKLIAAIHKVEEVFRLQYDQLKIYDHLCHSLFTCAYTSTLCFVGTLNMHST